DAFPGYSEGELSRLRANLVNQDVLAEIARSMGVGDALYLGVGELKSGGFDRPSILADAVEALLAAISFDADFAAAEQTVRRLFARRIANIDLSNQGKDPKTLLQEALQARRLPLPKYRIEHQSGEGCDARFDIACDLGELAHITRAQAASRRAAEQGILLRSPELRAITTADYPTPARRPADSRLDCSKIHTAFGITPSDWQSALGNLADYL
ncbi:MAG: sugar nucleotide-binding protein, partial [Eikenella corrodens]|nr:sugar nucleotide-binding protein [Eikenella corrodens]